jgi:hypothetical protein
MAYLQLDINEDIEYQLVGVSCHENDYRFVWKLNRAMVWNLERADDLCLEDTKGKRSFPRFVHTTEEFFSMTVIANHAGEGVAVPEWTHFDFLLKFENMPDELVEQALRDLRKIPGVLAAAVADPDKLKTRLVL